MPVFPSGSNTYQPSTEASNSLVVDFSRNPKKFALPNYVSYANVKKNVGLYVSMTVEEAGRLLNTDLSDFAWYDGNDAPQHNDGTESFDMPAFATKRFAYGFNLGDLTIEQATWDILAQHGRIKAQQAMTARTQKAATLLNTSGNFGTHTNTATVLGGGKWDVSTSALQYIQKSLHAAAETVLKDSLGAVTPADLILVINPTCARLMRSSQEIVGHIVSSPAAVAQVRGEIPGRNVLYGLPDQLYGYNVVVEDAVKTTSRKGATAAKSFVWSDTVAVLLARPGELEAPSGGPNFSTATVFLKEDMTVETERDNWHRKTRGRIVDDFDVQLTASVSGYCITAAVL